MRRLVTIVLVSALALGGCATTRQARSVTKSGFLGDYSQLSPGGPDQAKLVYWNPKVRWAQYDKIILEPVTIWRTGESSTVLTSVSREELQDLADLLHATIRSRLGEYQLVDAPGPGVMRVRVALTEAGKSFVPLDVVSTVVPQARAVAEVTSLATRTPAFVGAAAIEIEALNSVTGERLAAAVDRRVGAKSPEGVLRSWDDVEDAFQVWADLVQRRLREKRQGVTGAVVAK